MGLNQTSKWTWANFEEAVEIWDSLRQPINSKERAQRILGKSKGNLYPYYGATGQVGYIDSYLSDGEYVLLGEDGAPFLNPFADKAYLIKGKAWVNNHAHILRSKYNNKFLCYYLNHFDYHGFVTGTTRYKLTQAAMKRIPVPVPAPDEQERIVSKIEELFSKLDASVAELQTAKEKLNVYRQAVLKKVFSSIKNYVPFGNITDARLGKMLDKEKNTGTPQRYLRNINVRWFRFDLSNLLEMRIGLDEIEKYSIQYGDLVICEGGEPGRCAVWEEQKSIFYQKALHRVRFTDGSNPKFYMYYLWFAAQTGQLKNFFTGSGIKHLTGQSLAKVPVPNPDKNMQDYAVSEIEFRLSVCDNIEQTIEASLQQAEALRQSILKQAFEGKI